MKRICWAILAILGSATFAQASTFHLALESDTDRGDGEDVFVVSYDDFAGFQSNAIASSSFSQLNVGPLYSSAGLVFDGQYRLLLERDVDSATPSTDLFVVTYDTIEDLISGTASESAFSTLNIASGFSSAGIAYDGQYRLLLETDEDSAVTGDEVYAATFASFEDLISGTTSNLVSTNINIASAFSGAGLAYDGQYRFLLESNEDATAENELFQITYATFDDLIAGSQSSGGFSQINIGPGFSGGGLAFDGFPADAPAAVPLPAGLPLLLAGLGLLAGLRKRRAP